MKKIENLVNINLKINSLLNVGEITKSFLSYLLNKITLKTNATVYSNCHRKRRVKVYSIRLK